MNVSLRNIGSHKSVIGTASILIVILMFCVELAPYLSKFINQVFVEIAAYIIAFACMMIVIIIGKRLHYKQLKAFWVLLFIYLTLLFIRLCIDFVIPNKGFFLYKTPATIMFFYFFPILLPAIFFSVRKLSFDVRKCFWICAFIFAICMFASYSVIISGAVKLSNDGRYASGFGIFSISYGQYACTLILISIYLFGKSNTFQRIILTCFIMLGAISIALSGSRGPFITLFICVFIYTVARKPKLIWLFILIGILFLFGDFIKEAFIKLDSYLNSIGITSFSRIVNTVFADDGLSNHSSGRVSLFSEGWELFLSHPLFGNSFLIPGKIYVHNIIIEQFMATGIIGGSIFLIYNIIAIIRGLRLMYSNETLSIFPLLMFQYFIFGCLSVSIISLAPYWLFLFLTINNSNSKKYGKAAYIRNYSYI